MRMGRWNGWITIVCLCGAFAVGQAQSLAEKAYAAYQRKDFTASGDLYLAAIRAGDTDLNTFYNGACALALAGRTDAAFGLLDQLQGRGWADANQLRNDVDFKGLHGDARWPALLDRMTNAQSRQERFWNSPALRTPYQPTLSEDEKVAGLSRLWAEAKYNFAYFDLVPDLDWDRLYVESLPRVRQTKSTLEYYRVLMEIVARLKDGHSNVNVPEPLVEEVYARPLIATRLIEDRVLIRRVIDDKLASQGIVPGVEILAVDGVPVREYAERRVAPYQSASTKQDLAVRMYEYALLAGAAKSPVELTLRDAGGAVFQRTLPRVPPGERAKLLPPAPPFEFKLLANNIGYVALNTFDNEQVVKMFEEAFDRIAATDALVIDIRNNGGGNSGHGWKILSTLTDKPFRTSMWRTRQYRPAHRAWGMPEGWHEAPAGERAPDGKRLYAKPVVVLLSPRTFSAAEDFAVAFDAMGRGRMIGEATGGSTGQPLFFPLPGGGSARVCTKRDSYPDGRAFVGVGVQPQLPVAQTVADFRADRDTVLEAALKELAGKR